MRLPGLSWGPIRLSALALYLGRGTLQCARLHCFGCSSTRLPSALLAAVPCLTIPLPLPDPFHLARKHGSDPHGTARLCSARHCTTQPHTSRREEGAGGRQARPHVARRGTARHGMPIPFPIHTSPSFLGAWGLNADKAARRLHRKHHGNNVRARKHTYLALRLRFRLGATFITLSPSSLWQGLLPLLRCHGNLTAPWLLRPLLSRSLHSFFDPHFFFLPWSVGHECRRGGPEISP